MIIKTTVKKCLKNLLKNYSCFFLVFFFMNKKNIFPTSHICLLQTRGSLPPGTVIKVISNPNSALKGSIPSGTVIRASGLSASGAVGVGTPTVIRAVRPVTLASPTGGAPNTPTGTVCFLYSTGFNP